MLKNEVNIPIKNELQFKLLITFQLIIIIFISKNKINLEYSKFRLRLNIYFK